MLLREHAFDDFAEAQFVVDTRGTSLQLATVILHTI
jgi:hypothetical protein